MMSLISKLIAAYSSSTSEESTAMTFSVTLLEVSELLLAVVKFFNFCSNSRSFDITSFLSTQFLFYLGDYFLKAVKSYELLITNHLQHIVQLAMESLC